MRVDRARRGSKSAMHAFKCVCERLVTTCCALMRIVEEGDIRDTQPLNGGSPMCRDCLDGFVLAARMPDRITDGNRSQITGEPTVPNRLTARGEYRRRISSPTHPHGRVSGVRQSLRDGGG